MYSTLFNPRAAHSDDEGHPLQDIQLTALLPAIQDLYTLKANAEYFKELS